MGLGYSECRPCQPGRLFPSMHKFRIILPVMLLWTVTVLAAYYFGLLSNVSRDPVVATGPGAQSAVNPPVILTHEPADVPPVRAEPDSAHRILAAAREDLRTGLLSQKGVLRAFNRIQSLDALTVIDAVMELEAMDSRHPDHGVLMLAVMGRWAELDGDSAMEYAERKLSGDLRAGVIVNVVSSWAENEPGQAIKWYHRRHLTGQLGSWLGTSSSKLLTPIYLGLAGADPEAAFSSLVAIEDSEGFRCAVDGMAAAIVVLGRSEQMLRRAGEFSGERQALTRAAVLKQWARVAPTDAAAWVLRMTKSGERSRLIRQVGEAWIMHDPERAVEWLLEHTAKTIRADVLRESIALWAQRQPNKAATWLRRLNPGPDTDQAIAALARQIVHRHPEGAFSWASTINNRVMREQTVASVFAQWAIRYPQAASKRLNEADFPAEQMSKLRLLVAPNIPSVSP